MLIGTYRTIWKLEETMLRHLSGDSLSLSEMHMLESIGAGHTEGVTATDIAQDLDITPPSVTAMLKRLEKKGYITKVRSSEDARRINVGLTELGRRAETAHRYFHRKMVREATRNLSDEELRAIEAGLRKMNNFMQMTIEEFEAGREEEEE